MDTLKVAQFQGSGQSQQIMEPIPDPNVGQEIGLKNVWIWNWFMLHVLYIDMHLIIYVCV